MGNSVIEIDKDAVNAGAVKRMAPLKPAGFQKFRRRRG